MVIVGPLDRLVGGTGHISAWLCQCEGKEAIRSENKGGEEKERGRVERVSACYGAAEGDHLHAAT